MATTTALPSIEKTIMAVLDTCDSSVVGVGGDNVSFMANNDDNAAAHATARVLQDLIVTIDEIGIVSADAGVDDIHFIKHTSTLILQIARDYYSNCHYVAPRTVQTLATATAVERLVNWALQCVHTLPVCDFDFYERDVVINEI